MPFRKRKSFVITPVYKGFWEVLVIISKKSSYSCLWSCKWGDSPLVSWGGGEPTLRLGSGSRGLLLREAAQRARLPMRSRPLQPRRWAPARVSRSPTVSTFRGLSLGIFTLVSFFFWAVCSFSPRASVEQRLVPLEQYCMGKAREGSELRLVKASLPLAVEVLRQRLVSSRPFVARYLPGKLM